MAQVRIKHYKVTKSQIIDFCLGAYWVDYWVETGRTPNPFDIIQDLQEGKTWTYKGVPIQLKPKFPLVGTAAETNETK